MEAKDILRMDRETYLAWAPEQVHKHEWINGRVYAMSGARPRHNRVQANLQSLLRQATRGGPCLESGPDQGIFVEATDAHLYPDVSVVCGEWKAEGPFVTNPTLIVEVLSPSTAVYDRGAKLEHYMRLPSVQHILFVDPDRRSVLAYRRNGDAWEARHIETGVVPLAALDTELALLDIYADLERVPAG